MGTNRLFIGLLAALTLLAVACGDDDGGTDAMTMEDTGTDNTTAQVQAIMDTSCATAGCHEAGAVPPSLVDVGSLVGMQATTGDDYVVPGDAATSYLFVKVNPAPPAGMQMPLNAAPLSAGQISMIESWINGL